MPVRSFSKAGEPVPRPSSRRRRRSGWLLTALKCFAAVLLAGILVWAVQGCRQVAYEEHRVRDAGEPLTGEELEAFYRIPPGHRDATRDWEIAFELLREKGLVRQVDELPYYRKWISGFGDPPPPEIPLPSEPWPQLAHLQALLDPTLLETLHRAAQPGATARFAVPFADGPLAKYAHHDYVRTAGKLFELEAYTKARQGDTDGVVQAVQAIFSTSEALEYEPLLESSLQSAAHYQRAYETLARLLPHVHLSDEQLRAFRHRTHRDFRAMSRRALIGERAMLYDFVVRRGLAMNKHAISIPLMNRASWEDRAKFLEIIRAGLLPFDQPFPQALDESERYWEELTPFWHSSSVLPRRYVVTNFMTPPMGALLRSAASADAQAKVLDTTLAVLLAQRRSGNLPNRLDEIVGFELPAVPRDPLDGQPLRYRPSKTGFIVYSVGQDRTDDQGADETDEVLSIPLPSK